MKKQIFKLTSILLAMVMVFTMFTMIPISAEGVDKATAVSNLKTAWRALDYNSYMAKTVFNYCLVGAAAATWDAAALTPALDAPDDAACTNNYVYNLAGSSSDNPVKVAAFLSTNSTSPIMPYDINEVDDMYFYYKTDDATEITTRLDFRKTDSTGSAWTNSGFSGTKNIPGTSGEWVKFSFNDYLALFGVTFSSRIINNGNVAHNLISCFGFDLYTTSDTTISISNLFIDGDPNVAEARNFTDDEWIVKVVDTDLTELKAQYNDAEDSPTWTAFVDAFNVVKDSFGAEVVQIQAVKNLKNAWKALEETQKTFVNVLAPEAWWNASGTKNTATYSNDTTYGYLSSITGVTSTGYASSAGNADPFLFLYGDSAKRFTLNGYKDLGFWFKATSDISARLHLTISSSYGVTETVLTGDNEWHFVSLREVMGETIWTSVYATIKDSGLFRIYVDMGAIVDPEVSSVDVTFGGAYATPIFTGADGLEGEDLVLAANNVDLDRFADCAEKTAFESALAAAINAFPNIGESLLKAEALNDLRTAWDAMLDATPTIKSNYTHYGFWNASVVKTNPAVTATDYGNAITVTGITTTATEYGNADGNPYANLLIYQTGSTCMIENAIDVGFWYKTTGDINVQTYMMFGSSSYTASAATGVLIGGNEWRFYSLRTAMGETVWSDIVTDRKTQNFYRYYIDLGNVVDDVLTSVDVTFGGAAFCYDDTTVSAIDDENLVAEAVEIDTTKYLNADAFKVALSAALEFYPELKAEVGKANSVADLKAAWQSMTYTKNFNLGIGYYGGYKPAGTLTAYAVDDAPAGFAPVPSYKFNYAASAMQTGYSLGIDGKTSMVPFKMDQISDIKVWYKSTGDVTASAVVTSTDLTNGYSIGTSGFKTLPSTNGEWKQISYIEWFESAFATTWSSRIINYTSANNSTDTHFVTIGFGVAQADVDITFGAMTIVPTINVDLQDSASWSNAQWVVNSFDVDLADYADGDAKETFKSAREAAKGYYTENFAAQDVIDAANKLGGIGLKPSTLIEHAQIDEGGVWAVAGASYSANTNYLSNNGDQYVTINTEDFGNPNCSPDSGAVQYEAVTEGGIKLADIDDIFFSYKIENFVPGENGSVAARIWFFDERYAFYEEDEDGNIVKDEDGNVNVIKNNWTCDMATHGTTRYFAVNGNTDGWATTSLATIFGSDWKTNYIKYLNGDLGTGNNLTDAEGNAYAGTITADNTYITKLALGFNGYNIEGDYADVTLGSMYVDYADDRFAIDADVADPAAVLAEALTFDASGCKKADADAFKKAVKALADALEENISADYCVAGNKAVTLVDLSLLARYVDAADKDAFVANNYIDLIAADINDDDVINEADVTALRLAMLTPAED